MKRKEDGFVSLWLHSLTSDDEVTALLLGIDGDFTPFPSLSKQERKAKQDENETENEKEKEDETNQSTTLGWKYPPAGLPPSRMLFLSAGVGITPLMAMLRGLRAATFVDASVIFLHSERFVKDIPFCN